MHVCCLRWANIQGPPMGEGSPPPSKGLVRSSAKVSRIGEHAPAIIRTDHGPAARVIRAGVADKNCSFLDMVPALAVRWTLIDRVFVVKTTADGVTLDDLEAHAGQMLGL